MSITLTIKVNSKPVEAAQVTVIQDLMKLKRIIKTMKTTRKITIAIMMKTANEVKSTGQNLAVV